MWGGIDRGCPRLPGVMEAFAIMGAVEDRD
jgi:hypothetical protein